jgi:hypothetical protein
VSEPLKTNVPLLALKVNELPLPLSVMLLAVPKLSVQGFELVDVTTRFEAKTTGASITCVPSMTEIVAAELLLVLLNISVLLPLSVYPVVALPEPKSNVPSVTGSSSVTDTVEVVEALIAAIAPSALGTKPFVQLLELLQLPLTADAQKDAGVRRNASVCPLGLMP